MEEGLDGGLEGLEIGDEVTEGELQAGNVVGLRLEHVFEGDATVAESGRTEVSSASFEAVQFFREVC